MTLDELKHGNYSVLSSVEILALLEHGIIENSDPSHINSASLDIYLGEEIEVESSDWKILSLAAKDKMPSRKLTLNEDTGWTLAPGQCILAHSKEVFNLPPWLSAEYKLNSSMARIFLEHMNAGWCDAGWNGSVLTLELKNNLLNSFIHLQSGDKIGQIIFYRHEEVPAEFSYATKGRYNGCKTVSGVIAK